MGDPMIRDTEWIPVPGTKALQNLSDAEKGPLLGNNAARFYNL